MKNEKSKIYLSRIKKQTCYGALRGIYSFTTNIKSTNKNPPKFTKKLFWG